MSSHPYTAEALRREKLNLLNFARVASATDSRYCSYQMQLKSRFRVSMRMNYTVSSRFFVILLSKTRAKIPAIYKLIYSYRREVVQNRREQITKTE